jgi:formylglycine-generating enzyme required for sulfatase activity
MFNDSRQWMVGAIERQAGVFTVLLVMVALLSSLMTTPALASKRVALIVANGEYKDAPLANPTVDASLVEGSLRSIGFEVEVARNVDLAGFDAAVTKFSETAKGADIALFYFAGHGFAVNDGIKPVSMLMATSADVTSRSERILRSGGIPLDDIVQSLASKARTTLVFVDACRNDPRVRVAGGGGRGLSRIDAIPSSGLFIGLSTRLGDVAADGDAGKGSPFARAFAGKIGVPGLRIDDAFADIREAVRSETGNKQAPDIVQNDLPRGALVLVSTETVTAGQQAAEQPAAQPSAVDPRLAEAALIWPSIESSKNRDDIIAFRDRFRGTFYEGLAEGRLKALSQVALLAPVVPALIDPAPATDSCDHLLVKVLTDEKCLKAGDVFRDLADSPEVVVIPAGTFTMGSPENEADRLNNEGPLRDVTIAKPFAVGKHPVTRGEFAVFVADSGHDTSGGCHAYDGKEWKVNPGKSWREPGFKQDDDHPVVCVNWNDAQAYVKWLSAKTGSSYRLLSEAEFEYAARGQTKPGTYPLFWFGTNSSDQCAYANGADQAAKTAFPTWDWTVSCDDGYVHTAPIGSFRPNAFGLHDMAGNVYQWVDDCYADSYIGAPKDGSAKTAGSCEHRVLRAGSWIFEPRDFRAALRMGANPDIRTGVAGFRVARTL